MRMPSSQTPVPQAFSQLGLSSSVSQGQQPSLQVDIPRQAPKVGIIGAGIGGLYAAYLLQKLGIDYEILEAGSRLGGRLYTHRMGDRPNDYYVTVSYIFGVPCIVLIILSGRRGHAFPEDRHHEAVVRPVR